MSFPTLAIRARRVFFNWTRLVRPANDFIPRPTWEALNDNRG